MKEVFLSQVAEINPKWDPVLSPSTSVSFVGMADLSDVSARVVSEEKRTAHEVRKGYTPFTRGDLLIAKITPCFENGKIGIADIDEPFGAGSTEFHVVRPMGDLDARYALHYLRRPQFRIAGKLRMTGSGGQRRVPVDYVSSAKIPLPSMTEQRRIADILDKAEALRAKRREAIAHLDSLGQSIFHEMFGNPMRNERGWELKPLRTVLAGIDSGKSPVCASNPALQGGSGVLKLSAVTSGHWVPQENKAVEGSLPDLRNEVALGDVLFTRKNTPQLVAAVAQVDSETGVRLFLPDLIFRLNIRDEDVVMREFLVGVLQNEAQRSFVQSLATGSSQSMVNISKPKLMGVRVPVPPIELQRQFSKMVSGIRLAKEKNLRQLDELDNLFLSLQDRAFRGEV